MIYSPSVTTVRVDFTDMAKKAVTLIDKHQNDPSVEDIYVTAELKARESCGCLADNHSSIVYYRCMNLDNIVNHDNLEMQFCFMNIQLGRVEKIEEIYPIIQTYIHKAKLHFKIVMIYNIIMIHTAEIGRASCRERVC